MHVEGQSIQGRTKCAHVHTLTIRTFVVGGLWPVLCARTQTHTRARAHTQARTSADLTSEIVPGEVVRILWANGSAPGATQRDILEAWQNVTNSMFLTKSRDRGELFEATVTYPQDPQTLTLSG